MTRSEKIKALQSIQAGDPAAFRQIIQSTGVVIVFRKEGDFYAIRGDKRKIPEKDFKALNFPEVKGCGTVVLIPDNGR